MKRLPLQPSSTHKLKTPFAALHRVKTWLVERLFQKPDYAAFASALHHWIDPASLQFRLTVGVTVFSALGLGGLSSWTSWRMQEILVNTHTDAVKYLGDRLPEDVQIYNESFSLTDSLQFAIDKAPPNVLIWIAAEDGRIIAQSQSFQSIEPEFRASLFSLRQPPTQPRVYRVEHRYLVLCSNLLQVQDKTLGRVQIAQDITNDQIMLNQTMQGLQWVTGLAFVLLAVLIAWYIRQSLEPLRHISQMASTISAHDLSQTKMTLDKAPTEVKELAEKLNEMLSRLGLSWEQQCQLLDDISHELRTPLSVSFASLQCMQRRKDSLNEMQQELLETALAETDRTIQLLQRLLDLARADNSCTYFRSETLNLNDLVADVVMLAEKEQHHPIQVRATQEIWMTTDRACVSQILTHLLENAAKYSLPEHPIVITLSQLEPETKIEIRDYGCGIDPEQQERIFDRFYRVDHARSRTTGGVGLGLSIVKTLVESMNGQIRVWSYPGEGSLFTVTLPSQLHASGHPLTPIEV